MGFISHRAWFPIFLLFWLFSKPLWEYEKYVFIDCSFCVSSTFRMFTHISHSHTLPLFPCLFPPSYSDLFIKQAVQVLPICPHTPKVDFHAGVALSCFVSLNEYEWIFVWVLVLYVIRNRFHFRQCTARFLRTSVCGSLFKMSLLISTWYYVSNIKLQLWI